MSKTKAVWKFAAEPDGVIRVKAPAPQDVVLFEMQRGTFCCWVEVYPGGPLSEVEFRVFGTGHEIPADAVWIKSCTSHGGDYVWHLYQTTEWKPVGDAK